MRTSCVDIVFVVLSIRLFAFAHGALSALQEILAVGQAGQESTVGFSSTWSTLGPFRIGTREAIWGVDPIELNGGIRNVRYDTNASFHSPLANDALVRWTNQTFQTFESGDVASVEFVIDYPHVDFGFLQKVYGWAGLQYQAWAKGALFNRGSETTKIALYPDGILELWVNDLHVFGGDFFTFRRAPVVIDLHPGANDIDVRLVRDVRSMGGIYPPATRAELRVSIVQSELEIVKDSFVLPDVVANRFNSPCGSVTVRNQAGEWLKVDDVTIVSEDRDVSVMSATIWLAPGQSRPIKLDLNSVSSVHGELRFSLRYAIKDKLEAKQTRFAATLHEVNITSLQKVTFLHPSGVVSYAMLRPPPVRLRPPESKHVPILLNLHGAGLEADSDAVRGMFDDVPDLPAWIVSPTGMSPWSGDDWHTWGLADALAATSSIEDWVSRQNWTATGLQTEKFFVAGHSNGGQGTWHLALHRPDRLLAAAAASGYLSIENYVPYAWWREVDPLQSAVLHIARNSFRHELLTSNLAGVPVFQQHGSADENVPTYHSRLMNTLLSDVGVLARYSEMAGKGHWFTGSMTTPGLVEFYKQHLSMEKAERVVPSHFEFMVPNSNDIGSMFGIVVDQLNSPDRLGAIEVDVHSEGNTVRWHLKTSNIHRLHLEDLASLDRAPHEILLDNMAFPFSVYDGKPIPTFSLSAGNIWSRDISLHWKELGQRFGRQRGSLDAILNTRGPLELVQHQPSSLSLAVQASRNFLQYFGADSSIVSEAQYESALEGPGNVILFRMGTSVPACNLPEFPIVLEKDSIVIISNDSRRTSIRYEAGMGGVWLRPLPDEKLELVVWGFDAEGLDYAARLVPTLSGAGQPDFIIAGKKARWKGAGGALAMGFFDFRWQVSAASYLP